MSQPKAPPSRNPTLDALRGLAACAVMMHHFTMRTGEYTLFASAQIAVDLFFCLGGYVTAQAYQQKILSGLSFLAYFKARLLRLYPGFAAGMTIGLGALSLKYAYGLTDYTLPAITQAAIQNFLYLPFFADYTVQFFDDRVRGVIFPLNGPAWSLFFSLIGTIVYFYAIRRHRLLTWLLCGCALLGFFVATKIFGENAGWGRDNFLGGFPRVLYTFLVGILLYQLRPVLALLPLLPPALLIGVTCVMLAVPEFRLHTYYWFICAVAVVPVIVASAARHDSNWRNPRAQAFAHYLGGLSYPIYCIHVPIFSIITTLFAATAYRTPIVFAGIFFCLLAAHLVYVGLELPLQRYRAARKAAATTP